MFKDQGSAAVQLAKRRSAKVAGITGADEMEQLRALGADIVIEHADDLVNRLGHKQHRRCGR